jgi:LPPG:FO 2-phospho-L-lactate transferase
VRTVVETDASPLAFQRFLVQRRARDAVRALRFEGIDAARPAPGVLEALRDADAVLIAPSDPLASIGPILALPGVRDALRTRRDTIAAVSPIVAGRSLQPPAAELLTGLGHEASALGVARLYADVARVFVLDHQDEALAPDVRALALETLVTDTVMRDVVSKEALARVALEAIG